MGDVLTFDRPVEPVLPGTYRHLATLHEHGFLRVIVARVEGVEPPVLHLLLDGLPSELEPTALLSVTDDDDGRAALEVAAFGAYATLLATAAGME